MDQLEFSKSVFVGAMLGDGGIRRDTPTSNARFRVGHSIDKSEYLMWKLKHLRKLVTITDIGVIEGGMYEKSPNDYIYFNSRRAPIVTEMYELLYLGGKKTITRDLLRRFDSVALSILMMDDGSYDRNRDNLNYWLHLNAHSEGELQLFTVMLERKFGLRPKLQAVNKGEGFALRFLREDSEKIDFIIRPVVSEIACMRYKLHGDNPVLKDIKRSNSLTVLGI